MLTPWAWEWLSICMQTHIEMGRTCNLYTERNDAGSLPYQHHWLKFVLVGSQKQRQKSQTNCAVQRKSLIHLSLTLHSFWRLMLSRLQRTRSWIDLFKLWPTFTCKTKCVLWLVSDFSIAMYALITWTNIQPSVSPLALELLMAILLILPHCWKEHELSGVHAGAHPSKASTGAQGRSALSAATVRHSRIHICGIIIEDKYYQVQSERVLCICAGAKELWNSTPAWALNAGKLSWRQGNRIPPWAATGVREY